MGSWFKAAAAAKKNILRKLAVFAVVGGVLTAPQSRAFAQDALSDGQLGNAVATAPPVLTVTLAPIGGMIQDVNYVTSLLGQQQQGGMFAMLAGTFTQGIDQDRSIGLLVPLVDGAPQPIVVVPTSDVKAVLKRLEGQTGPVDELDDGTLVVAIGANTVYIKQSGTWAILAPKKDLLDTAPADPTVMFRGMGPEYLFNFRLKMQQVPAETRNMLVAQIRQGFDQAMAGQGDDAEATRDMAEQGIEQLELLINDTDTLQFGINIDESKKEIVVDTSFTAVAGTELASMFGGQRPIPSRFASVIRDDAAAYYHAAVSIPPEVAKQSRTSLEGSLTSLSTMLEQIGDLSPEQRGDIESLISRVADLAVTTLEEGVSDTGLLVLADQNRGQVVFGAVVADGNEAAQIVKDLAKEIEGETDAPTFRFDIDTYKGVTLHVVEAEVPADEDELKKMFGDTLEVYIGTGPKAVYVAAGNDSEALLKGFIDSAGQPSQPGDRPAGQFRFTLAPFLKYAQSIESNDTVAAMLEALAVSPDSGLVTVVQRSVANGQAAEFTLGEGVLRAVGAAIQQGQQQANPGF